jgi:ERCC4-related helicase
MVCTKKNVKIYLNQKYKLKLGWADVAQTQYCRNVRENLIKKFKNLLKSLRKCSLKMSTNCRIKDKIESKKNLKTYYILEDPQMFAKMFMKEYR